MKTSAWEEVFILHHAIYSDPPTQTTLEETGSSVQVLDFFFFTAK